MGAKIDFAQISEQLLRDAQALVAQWLPGGKLIGKEWTCGSLRGEAGESCKVNIYTGKWCDFATGEKGGDLVSLYAAIHGITQTKAARVFKSDAPAPSSKSVEVPTRKLSLVPPPEETPPPSMNHTKFGAPTASHCYTDQEGRTLFWIARYDLPDEKKQFLPWSWDGDKKCWVNKAWPDPRPLFNLKDLHANPEALVLVVEGEKSAEAAINLLKDRPVYVVTTWPGGAQASNKADFSPLKGREVLLWPDSDRAGIRAMENIKDTLHLLGVKSLKIIQVEENGGWDVADALKEGWGWRQVVEWARDRIQESTPPSAPIQVTANNVQINHYASEDVPVTPTPAPLAKIWQECGIYTNERGQPIINAAVIFQTIQRWDELKGIVWYDEFHDRIFTKGGKEWDDDYDAVKLMAYLQKRLQLDKLHIQTVREGVLLAAMEDRRNEPCDWIRSLKWDGVDRITDFFTVFFGTECNAYTKAVSRNFWLGLINRLFRPGCQVDEMVILEGAQGTFKSKSLEIIGGPFHALASGDLESKDFLQGLRGKFIIEIAELEGFSKAEDRAIKRIITTRTDRYRPSYARAARDFPRRCIFVGTTNEEGYLKDVTGGRRFWPLKVGYINREWLERDRDQFFAEAYQRFLNSESWYDVPADLAIQEQDARRERDEWEVKLATYIQHKTEVSIGELASELFQIPLGDLDKGNQRRIGKALRALGWDSFVKNTLYPPRRLWRKNG